MSKTGKMITANQFMFTIACFVQSSSLLSSFLYPATHQDSWMVVIAGFLLSLAPVAVYARLMEGFPGLHLMQILEQVFGRALGLALSVLYAFFFISLTASNLRYLGDFIQQALMPNTPPFLVMGMCLLLCIWAAHYGANAVTRYGATFSMVTTLILIASIIMVANQYRADNFLPMLRQPPMRYGQGVHLSVAILFTEIVAFLMIAPEVGQINRRIHFYWITGLVIGFFTILLCVLRDTAVLGHLTDLFALPFFETLRLVTLSESLSRMEVLFLVVLINLFFNKIILLYYVSIRSFAHITRQPSIKPFLFLFGAGILLYAHFLYPSALVHALTARTATPTVWTPFVLVIPVLTLIVARCRRLLKPREVHGGT